PALLNVEEADGVAARRWINRPSVVANATRSLCMAYRGLKPTATIRRRDATGGKAAKIKNRDGSRPPSRNIKPTRALKCRDVMLRRRKLIIAAAALAIIVLAIIGIRAVVWSPYYWWSRSVTVKRDGKLSPESEALFRTMASH